MFTKLWQENKFPFLAFSIWRIVLFVFLFIAINHVPLQENFLGGGKQNYLTRPYLWSWANFDGEHYLSIAQNGYKPLQYFYFPGYPVTVGFLSTFIGKNLQTLAITGLMVSNLAFLIGLIGFWHLLKLDLSEKLAKKVILLLLVFPTSFYFASLYTESLFFALIVWSFYFARQKTWSLSGITGFFAAITRVVGVTLLPALTVELLLKKTKNKLNLIWLAVIPLGLLSYMFYLYKVTGDPLEFFNSVAIFGQQRSSTFILPPQVLYRYIFKILPNLNYQFFSGTFVTLMEFGVGLGFLVLSIGAFFKLRLSYSLFLVFGYLVPTFSGSFSSMPRYVLVLFPGFIIGALYLAKLPKVIQVSVFSLLFIALGVSLALFTRGYWVA